MIRKDISELLKKYEQAKSSNKHAYFDAHEFEDLAEYFDAQNDLDTAREVINYGLTIHPASSGLIIKKLKILVYNGEYNLAVQLINRSSLEYDFDFYLLKIECYLQLRMFDDAHAAIEDLLDNEKDDPGALSFEAGVYTAVSPPSLPLASNSLKFSFNCAYSRGSPKRLNE